ncbi:TetR/AcrR family transcriptional regulator [Agromyces sp. NPDC049794]|uniref:TetR/AcrR family transcriptional regulator n=1 Tax=unclassified Agromyces TaxID=2639701 RepID=UPI0033E4BFD5
MADGSLSGIGKRRAAALHDGSADYAAKRNELIKVAADVFRQKGYAGATLNDVAAAFGTDRASLYYYFSSKEELFQACIRGLTETNLRRAEAIAARETSPRARIAALIRMLIESQVEHYPYMYLYIGEDMARIRSIEAEWAGDMIEITRQIEQIFIDTIAEGKAKGEFRTDLSTTLIANSIFGMTQWTHRWFVPGTSRFSADDLIAVFSAVLFEGIDIDGSETPSA